MRTWTLQCATGGPAPAAVASFTMMHLESSPPREDQHAEPYTRASRFPSFGRPRRHGTAIRRMVIHCPFEPSRVPATILCEPGVDRLAPIGKGFQMTAVRNRYTIISATLALAATLLALVGAAQAKGGGAAM